MPPGNGGAAPGTMCHQFFLNAYTIAHKKKTFHSIDKTN